MMKKVTVKQLMLLSLFVAMVWSASAQMKVGENPNTINKGSVLELEAKDKGVLYPRVALTASNAWLPLQGTAVAGMTVYNTATVTATTSATTSLSPGFYFWEDAKWNKLATEGAVAEGAEWVYDPTTKQTNLKRSGTAPFANKVYYDEKGLLRNYTQETIETWNSKDNSYKITDNKKVTGNILQRNSQSLRQSSNGVNSKVLNYNVLVADETADNYDIYTGSFVGMTEKDNTNNYRFLVGNYSEAFHQAKGNVKYLVGSSSKATLLNGAKSDGYLVGVRSEVGLVDNSTANNMSGIRTYNVDWGAGTIGSLVGAYHLFSFEKNASSTIGNVSGVVVQTVGYDNSSSKISDVKAFYYNSHWNAEPNTITVQNEYGLYLDNVNKGTNSNYAIYTNAGKVRFGDNVTVAGSVTATSFPTSSDRRYKENVVSLGIALATIGQLKPVSYQWNAKGKEQGGDDREHLGFIAQELEKVLPNLVSTDNKGYKSVNYIEVIPVLTKAIQEQQEQIAAQQIENKQLGREVAELKALVNQLLKK